MSSYREKGELLVISVMLTLTVALKMNLQIHHLKIGVTGAQ